EAVDELDQVFIQQRTRLDDGFLGVWINDVDGGNAAKNTIVQRLDNLATLDQGLHVVALRGTAIVFGDDQILRDIDQTTCEVTGVGGFERRISQTLTRPVRGNEVLQYVQTLAEIRGNGRFDDGAIRLCHQAPHTGQ